MKEKNIKTNYNKTTNIEKILTLILFVTIIFLGSCVTNNYNKQANNEQSEILYTIDNIPEYSSETYVAINNNIPNFTEEDFSTNSFENYSILDEDGRCGVAFANLSKEETMPKEDENRKTLEKIKPTGWNDVGYPEINLNKLYNKCHLIAYSLSAENANEQNIITGTRYFNISGMTPWENKVRKYLNSTNNHVLYRVTPIFKDKEQVARGITIEAQSVEDNGVGICFYVYIYNVQPGVEINYLTGESNLKK